MLPRTPSIWCHQIFLIATSHSSCALLNHSPKVYTYSMLLLYYIVTITQNSIDNYNIVYLSIHLHMSQLPQLFCKLACFNAVKQFENNICTCFPFCSLLNKSSINKSPSYTAGISKTDKTDKTDNCECVAICKHTSSSITDIIHIYKRTSKMT